MSLQLFQPTSGGSASRYQYVGYDTRSGFGSTNLNIPNFTNTTFSTTVGSALLTAVGSNATLGSSFTALATCKVTMVYIFSHSGTGEGGGISLNGTGTVLTGVGGFAAAGVAVRRAYSASSAALLVMTTCTAVVIMAPGDILRPNSNNPANLGTASQWSVSVLAEEI